MESLCPKLINTLSYEYLSYLQRAILTFKTNNFSIDGELENKIMLIEIAKQYMVSGDFNNEKIEMISTYYKNRFGITPQVACDIYTLSRAKKEN